MQSLCGEAMNHATESYVTICSAYLLMIKKKRITDSVYDDVHYFMTSALI